jgi:hypothetical protein
VIFDVRESGFLRYALQVQLMRSVVLSPEAVERIDAGFLGGVRPCVLTSRIGLNSAVTDDIDPAVEARHDRYDVDGVHVGGRLAAAGKIELNQRSRAPERVQTMVATNDW